MFDCWENGGKFDREPVILRTITSVILDDVLATCCIFKVIFHLKLDFKLKRQFDNNHTKSKSSLFCEYK